MEENGLEASTLFLALTRPPMKWGVPFEGFIGNAFGSFAAGAIMSPPYWLICIPIHLALRFFASQDHNMFRVMRLWMETKGNAVGSDVWGGSRLSALPIWPTREAKDVRGSV
jgi:type IV secretion system protein VirB3